MRIYLDTNIFQELKKTERSELLQLIQADAQKNIYCFSEAHLYDLARDTTDEKLSDMAFMETIVTNNCWTYDKKIIFSYQTPLEYYRKFDWTPTTSVFKDDTDSYTAIVRNTQSAIPLNFGDLTKDTEFPANFPEAFKALITKNTTMFDFMQAFVDYTTELTNEQKEFKKMVQYLHENVLTGKIYQAINLQGFDGTNVTDKEAFRFSYESLFLKPGGPGKYWYDLFLDLHSGLEIYGIVKGKPKKQKLMNMINDGRHAFFGAFCDIVVSKDADMINKTQFLYDVYNIGTKVMTIDEFIAYQAAGEMQPDGLEAMLDEMEQFDTLEIIHQENDEEKITISKKMTRTYIGYFNTIGLTINKNESFTYFTRAPNNMSTGTLTKEIAYVTQQAVTYFGPDFSGNAEFSPDELDEEEGQGKWQGREWLIGQTGIYLKLDKKIYIALFKGQVAEK